MKLNKKGFTLVELLAVIVILAVVMLIAVTAVGPLMKRARKGAFKTEVSSVVTAAQQAFAAEQLTNSTISSTADYYVTVADLCDHQYYSKGCTGSSDGYSGYVLIKSNGTVQVWLTSPNFSAINQTKEANTINETNSTFSETEVNSTATKLTLN